MGAAGDAGFLATPAELVAGIGPLGLAAAGATLLIHDGRMLFAVIFGSGSSPPTASTSLVGWYEWSGGNLETSFRGSDGPKAEQAMGDDAWNFPGWLASWEINGQFFTEGYASSSPFPDPGSGTRVNWTNGWGDHTYYILARDLPGSVKTYDPNTDQPDVTLPTQSLPDRSTATQVSSRPIH